MLPKSPFKFLDSYSKEDKEIFFGRDSEIEDIYTKIFQSNLLLIYGASGTGKSSLISCGLANKFLDADWLPISIRRGMDINKSMFKQLNKMAITPVKNKQSKNGNNHNINNLLKSVYLDYFKPIFLIFDQFEELFIFGNRKEWLEFIESIKTIKESNLQVKVIFVIRGEYLEFLSEFEEVIPDFFNNRIRIEKMTRHNAQNCVNGPCKAFNINLEKNFAENLLLKLSPERAEIELTYLQVFLDRIYKIAISNSNGGEILFTNSILHDLGNIGDVLSEFLDEQVDQIQDSEGVLTVLKAFVTGDGTKNQISVDDAHDFSKTIGKEISIKQVRTIVQQLVNRRILKDKDESDKYELRHDSIAAKIFQKITQYERDLIEVRQFLEYAHNEHVKRNFMLNESDLAYVAPFEEKLQLTKEIVNFIEKSKKVIKKKKRSRKQFYIGVIIIVALLIWSVILMFISFDQRTKAEQLAELARQESIEAQNQRTIAEEQKVLAEESAVEAEQQANRAGQLTQIAEEQRKLADDQRTSAEQSKSDAEIQRSLALEEKQKAEEAQKTAELNSQEAEKQRELARRSRILSIAQALATKSLQIQDNTQKSLLALQALLFNQEFNGDNFQTDIYDGLYTAHKALQGDNFNLQNLHRGSVIGIVSYQQEALTVGSDGKIFRVNFDGKSKTNSLFGDSRLINRSIAINREEKYLAIGTDEGVIKLYDAGNQQLIRDLTAHKAEIWALAFIPDNGNLISAGDDNKIIYWDLTSFTHYTIGQTGQRINAIAIEPAGNYVVVGLASGDVLKLSIAEDAKNVELPIPNSQHNSVTSLNFNYSGNLLAIGFETGNISLWSIYQNKVLQSLSGHQQMITDLDFRKDDKFMLSSSTDGTARLWNLEQINERPIVLRDHSTWVTSSSFIHNGRSIMTGDASGILKVYPLEMSEMSKSFCQMVNRNLTLDEWTKFVGDDIPYEKTCENLPANK